MTIKVQLDQGAYEPVRAHEHDAGLDLRSPKTVVVPAHGCAVIDTGVHIAIPVGYVGTLASKSGLNIKHNLTSFGTIDAGYTGSMVVKLYNNGNTDYTVMMGDKITQLVIHPIITPDIEYTDKLEDTERGNNGFGSSGR